MMRWDARMVRIATATAMLVMAGCAASSLDKARFQQGASIETHPVRIVAVDGATVNETSTAMAAGLRKVTVQMPTAAGFKPGDTKTIDLDVKACTQYWLVATRDTRASASEYDVKVDQEKRDYRCARAPG
jgi:hypothetical protein